MLIFDVHPLIYLFAVYTHFIPLVLFTALLIIANIIHFFIIFIGLVFYMAYLEHPCNVVMPGSELKGRFGSVRCT